MAEIEYEYDGEYNNAIVEQDDLSYDNDTGHWTINDGDKKHFIPRERVYKVKVDINESDSSDESSGSGVSLI